MVWIISGSKWDRTKCVRKHPPVDVGVGDETGLIKYNATVSKGYLKLRRKKNTKKIALDGCVCTVVRECLGIRSTWWKKAPLEISHPEKILFEGFNINYQI